MKLRETHIDLVGAFECTIENNLVISTGLKFQSEAPHDVADVFVFDVFDVSSGLIKEAIVVVFVQVGDNIEFRYRKQKFEVVSATFDLITLQKDGVEYFIKKTNIPFN